MTFSRRNTFFSLQVHRSKSKNLNALYKIKSFSTVWHCLYLALKVNSVLRFKLKNIVYLNWILFHYDSYSFSQKIRNKSFLQKVSNCWATKTPICLTDESFSLLFSILRKPNNISRLHSLVRF